MVLAPGEVHVWNADLGVGAPGFEDCWALLAADERARADRLLVDRDRHQFVIARGILRRLLAGYVDRPPAALVFTHNRFGKPSLTGAGEAGLEFNTSRAGSLLVCAIVRGARIGIDIEPIDGFASAPEEVLAVFSPIERQALQRLPPDARAAAVAVCWTRKEAFVKACGEGLSRPLDMFDVSVPPEDPCIVSEMVDAGEGRPHWSCFAFVPSRAYAGTIVVEGQGWRVTPLDWPSELG